MVCGNPNPRFVSIIDLIPNGLGVLNRFTRFKLWIVLVTILSFSNLQACEFGSERGIAESLLSGNFHSTQENIDTLFDQESLIPSKSFYRAMVKWHGDLIDLNKNPRTLPKTVLVDEVAKLQSKYNQENTADNLLAWGLGGGLAARALLANKQISAGYKLGVVAIDNLSNYMDRQDSNSEGRSAASFFLGIYKLYTNFIPDHYRWAISNLEELDSLENAIHHIEFAVRHSNVLSHEAGRTLLLELPWKLPGHCKYLQLAETLTKKYPNNADISLASQGLNIRCGHDQQADKENRRLTPLIQSGTAFGYGGFNYEELTSQAFNRIKANQGDSNVLLTTSNNTEWHKQFSLGNAYDIQNKRQSALDIYTSLVSNKNVPSSIRKSAAIRIRIPYKAPQTVYSKESLTMKGCD